MSRHRNVRQMIEDDYYDDYYDDDGYDDYDDEGRYVAPPKKKTPNKQQQAAKKGGAAGKQQNNKQQKQQQPASRAKSPTPTKTTGTLSVVSPVRGKSPPRPSATNQQPLQLKPIPAVLLQEQQERVNKTKKIPFSLVILGHVDAGKSTLAGRLLLSQSPTRASTQNVAWLLDEDENEQAHGITMDIGVKQFSTQKYQMVLLDAPGHADYVPAMITGTAAADGALLVMDATDWQTSLNRGQFPEHVYLARGLGITQLVIGINKLDVSEWNYKLYQTIVTALTDFLVHQVGFAQKQVRFVPVSGLTGENIVEQSPKGAKNSNKQWLTQHEIPTLLQALDGFDMPQPKGKLLEKPLRIVLTDVAESTPSSGAGGVPVRCKIVQGWVQSGESDLVLLPIGDDTAIQKVVSLHNTTVAPTNRKDATYAVAGETIDCSLIGVDVARMSLGSVVIRKYEPNRPKMATRFTAKLWIWTQRVTLPIIRGTQVLIHLHQWQVPAHVSQLICTYEKNGTTILRQRPRALGSQAQHAQVEVTLQYPIVLEAFADCKALGRFVMRRNGDSIAVGRVEQILM